jgi:hypothetical protein
MLHEFHQQAKLDGKPCHATYILSGLIEDSIPPSSNDATMQIDQDNLIMSSPPVPTQESSTSNGSTSKFTRTILPADEDNVQGIISFN